MDPSKNQSQPDAAASPTTVPLPAQPAGFYKEDESEALVGFQPSEGVAISWTASEFVAQDKSSGWYLALSGITIVVASIAYLLTKDIIATTVIVLAAIVMGVYGARQPRQLQYTLGDGGLLIGDRSLPFELFRSFAVIDEGAISSIIFMPIKRFGQAITVYFDPKDEERIVNLLAMRLPMENKTHDAIDRLMRRIRF